MPPAYLIGKMKRYRILLPFALVLCLGACSKPPVGGDDTLETWHYANVFARNAMNLYYLWQKEIESGLKAWKDTEDPIAKVKAIRYKDASGKDIDRWTMMTDDYQSFYSSVAGNGKTIGLDFSLYYYDAEQTSLVAVVTYTYKDSPARAAGLKRGDAIVKVNGAAIPYPGYETAYYALTGGDPLTVELVGGKTVKLARPAFASLT